MALADLTLLISTQEIIYDLVMNKSAFSISQRSNGFTNDLKLTSFDLLLSLLRSRTK